MPKRILTLFCFLILLSKFSFAQSLVNVNPLTGTANVNIPIYTVINGGVSLPISISYNATGVKTKDVENTAGMGWQLNVGGQISRQVRGLPDDCTKDNSGANRYGWMSTNNTAAAYATTYTPTNNGTTCSNGANDIGNINTNIPGGYDTEPDMFYVSAPGLSCQMVYDRSSAQFHPVNYQDLIISYSLNGGTGNNANEITSFTITNDKGLKYIFSASNSITKTTKLSSGSAAPSYFTTQYNQYQNGITYSDTWNLITIIDPNNNSINLTYSISPVRNGSDPVTLYLSGSTTQTVEYNISQSVTSQLLSQISTSDVNNVNTNIFNFSWTTVPTGQTIVSSIKGMGRNFQFNYSAASYEPTLNYNRFFLYNFSDAGCGTPINYQFGYVAVDLVNNITSLVDSTSNQVDYWGYYSSSASLSSLLPSVYVNPSFGTYPRYALDVTSSPGSAYSYSLLATATRAVTPATVIDGALNQITNADGGITSITYQPNDYYDVPSNSTIQGGGIRVQQIVESAGSNSTNNITRNYTYINPLTGLSSGAPITLPQFAFTIPYSGSATGQSLWTNATALSAYDLLNDDHTIMYSTVKMSQTGAGSTIYNYYVPATYWSSSAMPVCSSCTTTEWYPTVNDAASYNCSSNHGPIANLTYSYPFVPNPNYDFERGLPSSIVNYNDNGMEASEVDFTYKRSFTPIAINAFKYDNGPTGNVAMFYNKYILFYNTSELTASVINKVYDSNGANTVQTSTSNYTYGSTNHKLLTKQSVTNSDNSIVTTYYSYVKDFQANSGATNANINALYNLKQLNINAPVETYQQVTRGTTTVTTSANLTLYSPVTIGSITNYLPIQRLKSIQPNGGAFSPYAINTSAQTTASDPSYFPTENIVNYDNTGYPQTVNDNNKHVVSSYFDEFSRQIVAVFKNAAYNEVAFNDFDSKLAPTANTFTVSGSGSFSPVGSHAGAAAGIAATTQAVTSSVITKNTLAQNYVFSIWINNTGTSSGTLAFSGISSIPALTYTTGGWTYYEIMIPASNISGSTFTLSFTSSQNISIDDILLYPDVAEVNTTTFDPIGYYKIAQTNTNGVSSYFTNDQWGRVLYAYDQDKNIVMRKQYVNFANLQTFSTPNIQYTPNDPVKGYIYPDASIAFSDATAGKECNQTGETNTWTFSDNPSNPISGNGPPGLQFHSFSSPGTYTITLTKSSPVYGTKTATITVTVVTPTPIKIIYTNNTNRPNPGTSASNITNISFSSSSISYSFTEAQLSSGNCSIPPGVYQVTISASGAGYNVNTGGPGYTAVQSRQSDYGNNQCFTNTNTSTSYISTNYIYNANYLSGYNYSINLIITNAGCSN